MQTELDLPAIKKFVSWAHDNLIEGISARLAANGAALDQRLVERTACTWFSRLVGLRYLEVNGSLPNVERLFSSENGSFSLQIYPCLGVVGAAEDQALALLDLGREGDAFRFILDAVCEPLSHCLPMLYGSEAGTTSADLPFDFALPGGILQHLVDDIPADNWRDIELLGWLYHYYSAAMPDDGERLSMGSAAQQVRTSRWMGSFLVQNSLGRLLIDALPDAPELMVQTEQAEQGGAVDIERITLLDPTCGSGMLLAYAFDLYRDAYLALGYRGREIPALILSNNVFGADISERAVQMTSLVLALKAREHDRRFFDRGIKPAVTLLDEESYPAGSLMASSEKGSLPDVLTHRYDVVVSDPPFLGSGNYGPTLSKWMRREYPDSNKDMAASFVECASKLTKPQGYCGIVLPLVWMFIESYAACRKRMLAQRSIVTAIQMEKSGVGRSWGAVCLLVFANRKLEVPGAYINLGTTSHSSEQEVMVEAAAQSPSCAHRYDVTAEHLLHMPGCALSYSMCDEAFDALSTFPSLDESIAMVNGLSTGDNNRFIRNWWEVSSHRLAGAEVSEGAGINPRWYPCANSGGYRKWFGNNDDYLDWADDGTALRNYPGAALRNSHLYFKENIGWGKGSADAFAVRLYPAGGFFTATGLTAMGHSHEDNLRALALLNSSIARYYIHHITPTQSKSTGDIGKIPAAFGDSAALVAELAAECVELSQREEIEGETANGFMRSPLLPDKGSNSPSPETCHPGARADIGRLDEEAAREH